MPTWTIQSKTQTAKNRQQKVVWIFNNGFYIELCELEELQYPERQAFINSIQQNKLPVALLKSSNYPGDDVDYCFEDRQKEYGVTLAWRNYESEQVELKEYDPEWPNLYQQEYKKIVVRNPEFGLIHQLSVCLLYFPVLEQSSNRKIRIKRSTIVVRNGAHRQHEC